MKEVKIIVPITGGTAQEILRQAEQIAESAAAVAEWRYDLADTDTWDRLESLLQDLRRVLARKELLFTVRTEKQGGQFRGESRRYEELLERAAGSGCVDALDIEESTEAGSLQRLLRLCRERGIRSVLSHHDFFRTPSPEEILQKLRDMGEKGGDILKTAYMPVKPADTAAVLLATALFRQEDQHRHGLITMAMGELGKVSRVSGSVFGSDYTFAALGKTSAPGQLPLEQAVQVMEALKPRGILFLEGFMASGKSTVGKFLGKRTGIREIEMDEELEKRAGMTIPEIFSQKGEACFREMETAFLRELPVEPLIVSLGGGVPLREENRRLMREKGQVVYLTASPETVAERLFGARTERPVLGGRIDPVEIAALQSRRVDAYREASDLEIPTDGRSIEEIAEDILTKLNAF